MSTSPLLPVVTVQYEKCFELVSYERWSINRYDFYFLIITTKQNKPQEIRDFVEELFNNKAKANNNLWNSRQRNRHQLLKKIEK
ncbi:18200_t:CDS:2 [Funneliformis geosporum]|nr:18200_t:CDS:2 [Funneliformis geosporum]